MIDRASSREPEKESERDLEGSEKVHKKAKKKIFKNVLGSGSVFNLPNFVATVQRIAPLVC
jgi:hypothetical protein